MRISDWSSDVCSSDLPTALVDLAKPSYRLGIARIKVGWEGHRLGVKVKTDKKSYTVRDTAEASIEVKTRSEEHTSELQSLMRTSYAVFCLKNKTLIRTYHAALYLQTHNKTQQHSN